MSSSDTSTPKSDQIPPQCTLRMGGCLHRMQVLDEGKHTLLLLHRQRSQLSDDLFFCSHAGLHLECRAGRINRSSIRACRCPTHLAHGLLS